jgi:hypothetical protein
MASLGFIEGELKTLPKEVQPPLLRIMREVVKQMRFGHADAETATAGGDACENFGAAFVQFTTPSIANTEVSVAHSFGRTPYLLFPVLPLDTVNAVLVPLTVTRVADDKRFFVSSSETSAVVTVYLEA